MNMKRTRQFVFPLILFCAPLFSQVWNPNINESTYINPVIFADYSDPDVVEVGSDFYMTASSFNCFPALPVLHSKDLVNWDVLAHLFFQAS